MTVGHLVPTYVQSDRMLAFDLPALLKVDYRHIGGGWVVETLNAPSAWICPETVALCLALHQLRG